MVHHKNVRLMLAVLALSILVPRVLTGGDETAGDEDLYGTDYKIPYEFMAEPKDYSIDTWTVKINHVRERLEWDFGMPEKLVAVFASESKWRGCAVWQVVDPHTGRKKTEFSRLAGTDYGWGKTTTIDVTYATGLCEARLVDDLIALRPRFDRMPRVGRLTSHPVDYFIYIKDGDDIRKYWTQPNLHLVGDESDPSSGRAFWRRFSELTNLMVLQ